MARCKIGAKRSGPWTTPVVELCTTYTSRVHTLAYLAGKEARRHYAEAYLPEAEAEHARLVAQNTPLSHASAGLLEIQLAQLRRWAGVKMPTQSIEVKRAKTRERVRQHRERQRKRAA